MASSWTLRLAGIPAFRDILRRAAANSGALAATALWQEGLRIMNVSQRQVPVRWGVLRSTGTVHAPSRRSTTSIEVLLTYGGPAAPYAWIQHEKMSLRHDSPTKAKYLEDPVLAAGPSFEANFQNRMAYLFNTGQVLGSSWPTIEDWRGPAPRRRGTRTRRSPRRPSS